MRKIMASIAFAIVVNCILLGALSECSILKVTTLAGVVTVAFWVVVEMSGFKNAEDL
jgi:hypothetical protein